MNFAVVLGLAKALPNSSVIMLVKLNRFSLLVINYMLSFQDFFTACAGFWVTERTYHFILKNEIERSHTEFRATALDAAEKQRILSGQISTSPTFGDIKIDTNTLLQQDQLVPGFAVAFDTVSDKGEQVSMSLKALFVPDAHVTSGESLALPPLPPAAQVTLDPEGEIIQGFYLRDQGYSEAGAIAGRFTYQPTRQTLEMTTYYKRSIAVDQMRFVTSDLRLRTIVTYQRPTAGGLPTVIDLVGFGAEHKQS
jgi:hypothetical protein